MDKPNLKDLTKVIHDEILTEGSGSNYVAPCKNMEGSCITIDGTISAENIAESVLEYLMQEKSA